MSCSCRACKEIDSVTPHRSSRALALTAKAHAVLSLTAVFDPDTAHRMHLLGYRVLGQVEVVQMSEWTA